MNEIKLFAVGDISLQTKNNKHPFEGVNEIFRDKDILFGNLETVLANHGREVEKAVNLHVSPNRAKYLADMGFDILNIANNHIMDLGPEGFNKTLEVLNQNGLTFIGAGNSKFNKGSAIIERKGVKFGFLGYCTSGFRNFNDDVFINELDLDKGIEDIENLKSICDICIVSLHWGIEKVFYPSPDQIRLAHKIIESGANIILGHHPHVVQGIEQYKRGLIAYSLGNFQFEFNSKECYGKRSKRTNQSVILSLKMRKDGLVSYDIIPVKLDKDFVPYIVNEKEKKDIMVFISEISHPIGTKELTERWWFEKIAREYLSGNMKSWIIRIKKYGIKHLYQCLRWLISPFVIRCYIGILRRKLQGYD